MTPEPDVVDLLIVGSGIMGAVVGREVSQARPEARIVMVDLGQPMGETPGEHLHNAPDPSSYAYLLSGGFGVPARYVGASFEKSLKAGEDSTTPGMYFLSALGHEPGGMPAAALARNVGGMSVHWSAATPSPWGDERFTFGNEACWNQDLSRAAELLRVTSAPFPPNAACQRLLDEVRHAVRPSEIHGRGIQPMPVAGSHDSASGRFLRTGPSAVWPRITQPAGRDFELRSGTLVTMLVHDGQRVTGARLRDVRSGGEHEIRASRVLVAADPFRTPQLLFASGIRPGALGCNLNEHSFLTARVMVATSRFDFTLAEVATHAPEEVILGASWLPYAGVDQPFHGIFSDQLFSEEDGTPLAYAMAFQLYAPTEVRSENRLIFDDDLSDVTGMPRMTVEFGLSKADRAMVERGRDLQQRIGTSLGDFDLDRDASLLPAGSSLHFTGTARAGSRNDESSVTNPEGKVWAFDNLWLAGGAVVPTAVVGNSTLTAAVTAVRAAAAIIETMT